MITEYPSTWARHQAGACFGDCWYCGAVERQGVRTVNWLAPRGVAASVKKRARLVLMKMKNGPYRWATPDGYLWSYWRRRRTRGTKWRQQKEVCT